jgi:PhnB protein
MAVIAMPSLREPTRMNAMNTNGKPEGFNTITPNSIVSSVADAVQFYRKVFGAEELLRLTTPDGKVAHCELRFGDSRINLGESMEGWPEQSLLAQIYVPDSDATFALALKEGARELSPVTDMFFGSREGRVIDPFGNTWTIATHKRQVSGEEMQRLLDAMYS